MLRQEAVAGLQERITASHACWGGSRSCGRWCCCCACPLAALPSVACEELVGLADVDVGVGLVLALRVCPRLPARACCTVAASCRRVASS
eukprot:6526214-Alexandrium_andersonii.AAC.1